MIINLDDHITDNFIWKEMLYSNWAVRHGISNIPDSDLIYNNIKIVCLSLEILRSYIRTNINPNAIIHVDSCYRSLIVNTGVGGSKTSAHMQGLAADILVPSMKVIDVCNTVKECVKDYDQIIYEFQESGWTHVGFSILHQPRFELLTALKVDGKTEYRIGFVQ